MFNFDVKSFRFKDQFDVLDFLRWHNEQKKYCYVRYKWEKMQCDGNFEINIVKTSIANKTCVMRIPYVETREVTVNDLIGTTIECINKPW